MKKRLSKKDRKFKKAKFTMEVNALEHFDGVCAEKKCSRGVLLEKILNVVKIDMLMVLILVVVMATGCTTGYEVSRGETSTGLYTNFQTGESGHYMKRGSVLTTYSNKGKINTTVVYESR